MKTSIQQTNTRKAFFPTNEREFSEGKLVGAITRIEIGNGAMLVCYEGTRNGKESFIEQSSYGDINSWRCALKYLQFVSSLPEGFGERTIDLNEIHMDLEQYQEGTPKYFQAAALLSRAGLWRKTE